MDDYAKPITFGLGVVVGIAASSLTILALQREKDEENKSITSQSSLNLENKATQTIPLIEPKVNTQSNNFSSLNLNFAYSFRLVGPS